MKMTIIKIKKAMLNSRIISKNTLFKYLRFKRIRYNNKRNSEHIFNQFDDGSSYYVHIPKTAGTSLKSAVYGSSSRTQSLHFEWSDYRIILGKNNAKNYFSFSCVRNPWDRCLSAYVFLKNGGYNDYDKKYFKKYIAKYSSFKQFIMNGLSQKNIINLLHFKPQTHFIYNKKNECMVNFVIRFENIDTDYNKIKDKINGGKLRKYKVSRVNDNYKDHFDEFMIKKVAEVYQRDIKLLKYEF
jgi:hypothetical protein